MGRNTAGATPPQVIKVECYSGYKGEQRPARFEIEGSVLTVTAVLKEWIEPGCRYFRVRADGRAYTLVYKDGEWALDR